MTFSQVRLRQGLFPWLLLLILSLLWLTRQPEWTSFTTIYIDDAIFLNQAVLGDWSTLFRSHNGYLHGIPRILALIAASLPLEWAPIVIAIGSSFVLFLGMVFTWLSLRDQPGVIGRYALVIAGTLAIVPIASIETVSNIACLQWYLVSVAIVVTALGTTTLWRGWAAALFLLITALTTPLVIVALPGALWMFVHAVRLGKSRIESALPTIGLVTGLIPQIVFLSTNEGFGDTDEVPLISLTTYRTIMEMIGPMPLLGWDPNSGWPLGLPYVAMVLIALVFAVLGAAVFMSRTKHMTRERRVGVLAVILAVSATLAVVAYAFRGGVRGIFSPESSPVLSGVALTVIAAACILIVLAGMRLIAQGDALLGRDQVLRAALITLPALAIVAASLIIRPSVRTLSLGNPGGTRYVLPLAFIMWIVVVVALMILIDRSRKAPRDWLWVAPLVLLATVIVAISWSQSLGRPGSPTWSDALTRSCADVPPGTIVSVPTAPVPWVTSVPCP